MARPLAGEKKKKRIQVCLAPEIIDKLHIFSVIENKGKVSRYCAKILEKHCEDKQ
jgi:hypothetical protein